jgi:hypothetical protein
MKRKINDTFNENTLYSGMFVKLKRKPTFFNTAPIVWRTVKSVDFEKKKFVCDDAIEYKFKNIVFN